MVRPLIDHILYMVFQEAQNNMKKDIFPKK